MHRLHQFSDDPENTLRKSATPLQTPREAISALLATLPAPRGALGGTDAELETAPTAAAAPDIANPLRDAPDTTKEVFLTLHLLFPNELLPALDVLDRGLVTRLVARDARALQQQQLYVRSAQHHGQHYNARFSAPEFATHYEVRLRAWSCSCPAFAFSAYPTLPSGSAQHDEPADALPDTEHARFGNAAWVGGLSLGTDVPVCKHLLACLLAEHCALFAGHVTEREVSLQEFAGWTVG